MSDPGPATPPRPGSPRGSAPRLVGPVAVIVPCFPSVTGAALLREIDALEREGVPIMLIAIERAEPSLVPEEVEGWIERVRYLRLITLRVLAENASVLVRHPRRWLGTLARLAWDARTDLSRVAGVAGLYLGAVELGSRLRASGVRHVHAHDAELPALVAHIASRVHRSTDLPFSVTVHGHDIAASHAGLGTRLDGASFVRCTSHHAAGSLRGALAADFPDAPIVMIRRGIAASLTPVLPSRTPALGRPGIERALRVLCVARLEPHKGLPHLFEAMRLLNEAALGLRRLAVTCTIIGDGSERASLERLARSKDLEEAITFLGARSQREVLQALRSADVFVLPSTVDASGHVEGLPASLVEALAAGVPTIATRMSGMPELVIAEETGLLVEPEDAHALASALLRIVDDPEGAASRAARGVEHVHAEFELRAAALHLASEFERAGAALDIGDSAAAVDDDVAGVARDSAALIAPGTERVGVARVLRGSTGLSVELRLAPGSAPGTTHVLARRRPAGMSGSPVPETRALEALEASMALQAEAQQRPCLPRGLASDSAQRLEIVSHVEGTELATLLRRGRWHRGDPDLAASLAGEWLGRFERLPLPPGDSAAHAPEAIAARILHDAEADARRCNELGIAKPLVDRALHLCRIELREGLTGATCWSHGSFVPGHVVVSGVDALFKGIEGQAPHAWQWRVTAVGLGGLQPGVPGEDAATFLESLAVIVPGLASLGLLRRRRHELERAFLSGRDGVAPAAPIPALRAAKLLSLAARLDQLATTPRGPRQRARLRFLRLRISARILELTT